MLRTNRLFVRSFHPRKVKRLAALELTSRRGRCKEGVGAHAVRSGKRPVNELKLSPGSCCTRGTIAVSTRTDPTAEWAPLYTYEIPDGLFGDKVLIGPAQGAGSQTPGNLSYGRFSEFKLTPLNAGTAVLFR